MSESRAGDQAGDDARELGEIADALYALRPDAFAAAREDRVRQARTDGRPGLARELSRLRRPTQSAWLINLLWRDQREVMEQLFQLAGELSRAQAEASGADLHRLMAQRRELEAALLRRARALGEQAGVSVSASMEREAQETLAAALARPEVAEEVRSGRLVKPATYAGFGTLVSAPGPVGEREETDEAEGEGASSSGPRTVDFEARAAKRARERHDAAQRGVDAARVALDNLAGALAEGGRAVEAADQHQRELRQRLERLQQQVRDLQPELATAEQASAAAARDRAEAEKAHAAAVRALERAEQALKDAPKAG
jgi:hypothetical protein